MSLHIYIICYTVTLYIFIANMNHFLSFIRAQYIYKLSIIIFSHIQHLCSSSYMDFDSDSLLFII